MVKLSPSFLLLSSVLFAIASALPIVEMKRESDAPTIAAREPAYPAKRDATSAYSRLTRHIRPDYGAMNEGRGRPDYGAMSEGQGIPDDELDIDRLNLDDVVPL